MKCMPRQERYQANSDAVNSAWNRFRVWVSGSTTNGFRFRKFRILTSKLPNLLDVHGSFWSHRFWEFVRCGTGSRKPMQSGRLTRVSVLAHLFVVQKCTPGASLFSLVKLRLTGSGGSLVVDKHRNLE